MSQPTFNRLDLTTFHNIYDKDKNDNRLDLYRRKFYNIVCFENRQKYIDLLNEVIKGYREPEEFSSKLQHLEMDCTALVYEFHERQLSGIYEYDSRAEEFRNLLDPLFDWGEDLTDDPGMSPEEFKRHATETLTKINRLLNN